MPGNILIMNPGQLFRNHRTGAASAAFFKNPEEGTAARVKFRLTFQMRRPIPWASRGPPQRFNSLYGIKWPAGGKVAW